ncbi:MAG: FtsQ-type POTRA domain-containing protein [Myxococcaceae bacterium]
MLLRSKKNRRKVDPAKRAAELKAAASAHAPKIIRALGIVAFIAALGAGGWFGWQWAQTAPQLSIHTLQIHGNERATNDELLRISGLAIGQNLVSLDVAAAERGLAAHPWVKSAIVTRHFPTALEIQIQEHEPSALATLGDLYLVDAEGVPFKKLQSSDAQKTPADLPLLTGIDRDEYLRNNSDGNTRLSAAIALDRAFRAAIPNVHVSEVRLEGDAATIVTADGLTVLMGESPWDDKLTRLKAVRAELAKKSLTAEVVHLDNRAHPEWVAVLPKGAAAVEKVPGKNSERTKPGK